MRGLARSLALLLWLAAPAAAAPVEVEVGRLGIDPTVGSPVVVLREKGARHRELPIWVGPFEAQAIALELAGANPGRPLTHDLMRQLVDRLGGKLERVEIGDVRDETYFATLRLVGRGGHHLAVDARPSDAIALALRLHGPIVVAEEVFAKSPAATDAAPAAARIRGLTVQTLTPDVAAFFDAPPKGVLVAEVAGGTSSVQRGDVITAADDAPVTSVAELAARVDTHAAVRLSIHRGGERLTVELPADRDPEP